MLRAAAVSSDLQAYWAFGEGSGDVAVDGSGNGNDGTLINMEDADWVDGGGLEFDGVDEYVVITGYKGILGTQERTVEVDFKSTNTGALNPIISWGSSGIGEKYVIRSDPGNGNVLRVENDGGQKYGSINIVDGLWHHLVVVFPPNSTDVQDHLLYVDGILDSNTGGGAQSLNTVSGFDVRIGVTEDLFKFSNSIIRNVRVWNTAKTQQEI
jgi:hypothetical protein